jgi:hypothetical protein
VLNLGQVGRPPRVFSVEGVRDTSKLFDAVAAALPRALPFGSSGRAAIRELTSRVEVANTFDQLMDSWLYSPPLLDDSTGQPLGAVRMRARLGEARLLRQTEDNEVIFWDANAMSVQSQVGLSRRDGIDGELGAGGIVSAGTGVIPAGFKANGTGAWVTSASYQRTLSSSTGGIGLSRQMAFSGNSTALYETEVEFEVQPSGSAEVLRLRSKILLRTLTEEALRLEHASRRTTTPFAYPEKSAARIRPGVSPTNLDPVQPPDYLTLFGPTSIGSSIVGDVTGGRTLHDRVLASLNRQLPDLFPRWEDAAPAAFASNPGRFTTVVQNLTTLAEGIGRASLRAGTNSLLGDGLRLRFRREGLFSHDYYTLTVTGQLSRRMHRGSTTSIRAVDIAGRSNPLVSVVDRTANLRSGPEVSVTGKAGGLGKITGRLGAKYGYSSGYGNEYGNSATAYSLTFFPRGVEVFDHRIEYSAHLEHYQRPSGWRRTMLSWPLAGGWHFTESSSRDLLDGRPVIGSMTLWTPQERSWRPEPGSSPVAPPYRAPYSERAVDPSQARKALSVERPVQLTRPFHLEALNHDPGLLRGTIRQLLGEISGQVPLLTNKGTPAGQALADQVSAEMLKGAASELTGPGGLSIQGPIGSGTYRDWHWSAQVRARPRNWRVMDVIESATVEEYYAGGSGNALTGAVTHGLDVTATVGTTLAGKAQDKGAGNLGAAWKFHQRSRATEETVRISGTHERNLSGSGRYVVFHADLIYTVLAQARWRNLVVDSLPGSVGPGLREVARQLVVPDGLSVLMQENHAREVGLLDGAEPESIPAPRPRQLAWSPPEYFDRGLGLSALEGKVDLSALLGSFREQLPSRLRNLVPDELADDLMGGLAQLRATMDNQGIAALVDNLYDGGLPVTLHRRGGTGPAAIQAVLHLKPAGRPRFVDLRADADVENYHQGRYAWSQSVTRTRGSDLTLSVGEGQGRQPDSKAVPVLPTVSTHIGTSSSNGAARGFAVRIDNMTSATGPTARFEVPVRLTLEFTGGGLRIPPIEHERVGTLLVRVPETVVTPDPVFDLGSPQEKSGVRMLDVDQTRPELIVSWKNDSSFLRLPAHFGVDLVWGTSAVRKTAEWALSAVVPGGGIAHRAQLWSAVSNTVLAGMTSMINNAADRISDGTVPLLSTDQLDEIGMPLPVTPSGSLSGWRKVNLRLMSNLERPTLVGITGEKGETVRLEQRRVVTNSSNVIQSFSKRAETLLGLDSAPFGSDHSGDSHQPGLQATVAGQSDRDRTSTGRTGDSYRVRRHVTRTYLFKADVLYRVIAREGSRSAAAEVRITDGIYFRLTEEDAVKAGLLNVGLLSGYRSIAERVGAAAEDWKLASRKVDEARGILDQHHRALTGNRIHRSPAGFRDSGAEQVPLEKLAGQRAELRRRRAALAESTRLLAGRRRELQDAIRRG